MPSEQSKIFENNYKCWKIFGIWGGRIPSKFYTYYSIIYLLITFICFDILLTLNLIYTPLKIETVLHEIIFYLTEITIVSKVCTILVKRNKIVEAFDMLDGDEFFGDYENKDGILYKLHDKYKWYWKFYACFSHVAFSTPVILPTIFATIRGTEAELPISKYSFLNYEFRHKYYYFLYVYQSLSMYGHMMYNVNIDTFIVGLLAIAIAQLRLLNIKLKTLKLTDEENKFSKVMQDKIMVSKFNSCLRHYDAILKYIDTIQDILSGTMFVQFSVASMITCVAVGGLLLLQSTSMRVFFVLFLCVRTTQIFLPAFFGTNLAHEGQNLVFAAYSSDWIPRCKVFKRSLRLFMERAKIPVTITCLKMFPLSLITFAAIMKMAYSLLTLIKNFQESKKNTE